MASVMIDFETLGQDRNCAVLSLGLAVFSPEGIIKELEVFFEPEEQKKMRQVDPDTVEWWKAQSVEAKQIFQKIKTHGKPINECLNAVTEFLIPFDLSNLKIWSNGANFDIPILEDLYKQQGKSLGIRFWNHRCYRTMKSVMKIEKDKQYQTAHSALVDARQQAERVIDFWKQNPVYQEW